MATAHDVAAAIRARLGAIDPIKMQKLMYYCQGWTLAWDGVRLFEDKITAYTYGPLVRSVWERPRDIFAEERVWSADPSHLDPQEEANVAAVVEHYNPFTAPQLVKMTHREAPWKDAHGDRPEFSPSDEEITAQSMLIFFSGRLSSPDAPRRRIISRDDVVSDEEFTAMANARVARMRHVLNAMDAR